MFKKLHLTPPTLRFGLSSGPPINLRTPPPDNYRTVPNFTRHHLITHTNLHIANVLTGQN